MAITGGGSLLASDMDGTVIPLEVSSGREMEIAEFRAAVEESGELILAYVTGRGLALARKGIRQFGLPMPDFLVCDVGTSVHRSDGDGFLPDPEYADRMKAALDGLDFSEVRGLLEPVGHLLLQPQERQTDFKLSYHLPRGADYTEILASVRRRLEGLGDRVQAVCSVGAPSGTPLLDLLPTGGGKDHALLYLRQISGVGDDEIVYAGDSGNDLEAILAGFKAIVVANAGEELKGELRNRAEKEKLTSHIFFSQYPYAKGVLEGCRHFGIL